MQVFATVLPRFIKAHMRFREDLCKYIIEEHPDEQEHLTEKKNPAPVQDAGLLLSGYSIPV
jgi:hypothetical protein